MVKIDLEHWQAAVVNLLGSIIAFLGYIWYDVVLWKAVSLFLSLWLACLSTGETAIHVNRHGWKAEKPKPSVCTDDDKWRAMLEKKQ